MFGSALVSVSEPGAVATGSSWPKDSRGERATHSHFMLEATQSLPLPVLMPLWVSVR